MSPWRLLAVAALLLAGFWLTSQLTVSVWLAREAKLRQADWAQGLSPWRWDFRDPASVVRPGSHGLDDARITPEGLDLTLPGDGIASLSLNLRDGRVDAGAVRLARIEVEGDAPFRLILLAATDGGISDWAEHRFDAGHHAADLALGTPETTGKEAPLPIHGLHLRIESTPNARLHLERLALRVPPCADPACTSLSHRLQPTATPERLLAERDRILAEWPALRVEPGGRFGDIARAIAAVVPPLPALWRGLPGAIALLVLVALGRRAQARRPQPRTFFHPGRELALTLGLPLALLLAGWPARETPAGLSLSFAGCLLALALFPLAEPARWRWLGDRRAWRSALAFTAICALLIAPLAALDGGAAAPRDSSRFLRYPLWALAQQWLLLAAIAPRLRAILADERLAALACGAVFGLLHAPNFALMAFTCAGGTAWAWLGWRHRALLPLAASHAALGLWLTQIAPTWLLRSAEIGGRFLMAP